MDKNRGYLIAIIFSLLLQGCSIAYYQIRNELSSPPSAEKKEKPCNISYFISVQADPKPAYNKQRYDEERLEKEKNAYIQATQRTLTKEGCIANSVEVKEEAQLRINILISPILEALPQEFITGLSFGIIPTRGTRPSEYVFTLEDVTNKREHSYIIDNQSYNHLFFLPVFWVNLFTLDEIKVYKKALSNFIE
ncbi:MAG: hypothetical protein LLH30_08320 [Candidatus Manganitrophus sp. SA1]|nr:hypothetical protein [Candidatus Manganitrophus morganii]